MNKIKEQKAKGLVISKLNYRENDIIFDLLTEEGKRLSFFLKGGKKNKSRFANSAQIGNFIELTFSSGTNFNYPREIQIEPSKMFDFYSKSLSGLNFFSDIIKIVKVVSKDFESPLIYQETLKAFRAGNASQDNLIGIYNEFLKNMLEDTGFNTNLECSVSGETINEKEFYYHNESNKLFKKENRPRSMDLPLIEKDDIFIKNYLKNIFIENISQYVRLKF
jgi:DNA repair protein RecO